MSNNEIIVLKDFLNINQFNELRNNVIPFFSSNKNLTLKRQEHNVLVSNLIKFSNYGDSNFFSKINCNSYINITNRKLREPSWHLDHSDLTLLLPIVLSGNDLGMKYVDLSLPSLFSPIINRYFLSTIVRFGRVKQLVYEENNAVLMKGRNLVHTAAYNLLETDKRIILVLHF